MSMKIVSFQNKGVIDARAYRLFGASAKSGSNPIGFFGTGLKYAIAIFLRFNCKVTLYHGLDIVEFGVADVKMRESSFKVVTATITTPGSVAPEVIELPYTTELGKTWKPWQALRELWCNALDEGGEMQAIPLEPREGYTTITVEGQAAMDAWNEREKIMITTTPQVLSQGVEVHPARGQAIYFRGIRVKDLGSPSRLTYNIVGHSVELTEDRTIKYDYWAYTLIAQAVVNLTDEGLIRAFLTAPQGTLEYGLDISEVEPGDKFMEVLESLGFNTKGNPSAHKLWLKKRGSPLAVRDMSLTDVQQKMLEKAQAFCRYLGLSVDKYPARFTRDMEDGVLGLADRNQGCVWITERCFMMGAKQVAGTLMEELIHMEKGLYDETRALQNFLVDLVVSQYERVAGEPL